MNLSATSLIAAYAADSRQPPVAVTEQAKLHILDTIACIYAGTGTEAVKILGEANHWRGGPGDIPVPGWGYAKTPDAAAELLGTAAHAYDFDDKSYLLPGHPSAPIVSALLATGFDLSANSTAASGLRFIHAYVKGIEVAGKVGELIADDHTDQGWHNISTIAVLGASAACAALRGLNAQASERALAIAASLAGGILANSGTMVKPLHSGNGARAGFVSATLAARGFTACDDFLAGPYGFIHAFTGGRRSNIEFPAFDVHGLCLPPLRSEHFELAIPGIEVKRYPCCHVAHTGINGILQIQERAGFQIGEVERVICYVPTRKRMSYLQFLDPKTPTEARFSMNFTVAVAMHYGRVELEHFDHAVLESEEIQKLMRLIEMRLQDKAAVEAVDVEVVFKDGRRWSERSAQAPASWEYVADKFRGCMKYAFQAVDPERLLADLHLLDTVTDVAEIFDSSKLCRHSPA